jgi:UMF1 family MFS transporter
VTDRLLLLRLAPAHQVGEMFGLFGLAGKFSAVIGPIAFGAIVFLFLEPLGSPLVYQVAILSLLVLMVIGYLIVRGVPEPPAERADEAAAVLAAPSAGP